MELLIIIKSNTVKFIKVLPITNENDCVIIISRTRLRVNLHSIVAWMSRNSLLETGTISEVSVTVTGFEPTAT